MTDTANRKTLGTLISDHIGAIISAIVMGLLSYVIGTTRTGMTIEQMGRRLDGVEARQVESEAYHRCATRHIDMLEAGIKTPPGCDLGDKE